MTLKLLLSLLCIVWRLGAGEEYTNHWLTADAASVEFCSHDSFLNTSCQCNVDYSKDFCLQRKCRNFGYDLNQGLDGFGSVGAQDRCVCPPGFLGRNCEPVKCVDGTYQQYSSLPSEKTISILASYNSHMQESWTNGDIGSVICDYTGYGRMFTYISQNLQLDSSTPATDCVTKVKRFLDVDTCTDEETEQPVPCKELNIEQLNTLVQKSLPNSIIFVVTNMKAQVNESLTESILATAIARKIQINVVVYNNTLPLLFANDPSLVYLEKIATATFGTFVRPSVDANNEQYNVVSNLLNIWSNDIGVSNIYTDGMSLPVDSSNDLYIAAQTNYKDDINVNGGPLISVAQTDFWKLYKIEAGNLSPILSISNLLAGTKALVYSQNRLKVYSGFTSDNIKDAAVSINEASYSVSVLGASYPLVLRLESTTGVLGAADLANTFGTADTFTIGTTPYNRYGCQFNIVLDATCTSIGASVVTLITAGNKNSVSFPIYCASSGYGGQIYNNAIRETVEISHLPFKQSLAREFICGSEISHEDFGKRSFVIIADNTKDTNQTLSSVDNVFRSKDSVFLQLTDYASKSNIHYGSYIAAFTQGSTVTFKQQDDYGKFLTKVMSQTASAADYNDNGPVSVKNILVNTIQTTNAYSDILFVVNYDVSVEEDNIQIIKDELAKKRIRLYVLFVQTYVPTSDDVYRYLNDFAVSSGGVAVRLNGYSDLHTFFSMYYPILVNNDVVAKAFSENQRAGIALSNVSLSVGNYYLLLTNEDLSDDGPVEASILPTSGLDAVLLLPIIGELQVFQITVKTAGVFNIPVKFAGVAQLGNVILLTTTDNQDFVSLSFLDKDNRNRNDVVYGEGQFVPFLYSSTPFGDGSTLSITYSDSLNPAKPIYSGSIVAVPSDCGFSSYKYYVNYPWTCTQSGGLYHFKIDRATTNGTITRSFPVTCLGPSSGDCLNGGIKSGDNCVCPLQWTGIKCEVPVCLNGGTATPADTCECLGSFSGSFCESSIVECITPTSPYPDYRSDLSSLIIVADAQALAFSSLTSGLSMTGTPITVILYGDGNAPRIVQSTTNGQRLTESLKAPVNLPTPAPSATNDMYAALNLALNTQFTSRAFIVVYTSNPDGDVDTDILIRLSANRAEIRVLATSPNTPYSANFQTISLIGNGIPTQVNEATDFQTYLQSYVAPIFVQLQYDKTVKAPQRVFNVFQTGTFGASGLTVNIPSDSTFDNANVIAFVQVNGGRVDGSDSSLKGIVGSTRIYQLSYTQNGGQAFKIVPNSQGGNGTYSIEVLNYLKTAYGFGNLTNGGDERLLAGLASGQVNVLSIYSSPFRDAATSNPANFPYLSISEIQLDGTLSNSSTVLFSRKSSASCFYKHFTVLDVCSQGSTIGYQVQLTTRTSTLENRQQQFVLTCHKTSYKDSNTTCGGTGSPKSICECDPGYEGIDCQTPQCKNGVLDGTFCRCPVPYSGRRCENAAAPIPTTTAGTTVTNPVTSTPSQSTTVSGQSTSMQTTTVPSGTTQTTTAPPPVRAVAFVIDVIGTDDYAFNQTIQSVVEYVKAFDNVHYVMIAANWNLTWGCMKNGFQLYDSTDSLVSRLSNYWPLRKTQSDTKTASLSNVIKCVKESYDSESTKLTNSLSNNIFYLTQIELAADDKPDTTGLETFDKSSLVFSKFSKNADQSIMDSLKTFSPSVTNVRDYYNGVKTLVASTKLNDSAVLPPKPNRQCTFGLQTNIHVAIDRSLPSSNTVAENLNTFLINFRQGFNYIDNDENRCGVNKTDLPDFYNERTAITAFAYYNTVAQSTSFCPSKYNLYLTFTINGTKTSPDYTNNQVKSMGKYINKEDCVCTRFRDANTMKLAIWLPRSKGVTTGDDTYRNYLKFNTTVNAYHFVVPFYDMDDKDNDLFYQILKDQDPDNADYYLLPNAATSNVDDIIASLNEKICTKAGVDPTAIPPEMSKMHFENRHEIYYDDYFETQSEEN